MKTAARPDDVVLTADVITEQLRDMILSGAIGLGVQLRQEALASHFGVSRIPVREALKRLQSEGLVQHRPNAGSVVARKSQEELQEILDIRIGLETRALQLAIPRMRPADLKAAREIVAKYDASDDPREWTELNLEFHMRLYRPCGRPRLLKMIEELVRGVDIHLRAQQSSTVGRKSPQTQHKAILAACVARDAGKATRLLHEHIEHTQAAIAERPARAVPLV
jgi:DNA-binding GntR family transcriptional regulator